MLAKTPLPSLPYASPLTPRGQRRWLSRRVVVGGAIATGLLLLSCFVTWTEEIQVDAVTCSTMITTTGPLGVTRRTQVVPSALELRLKNRNIPWTPTWNTLTVSEHTLWSTSRACSRAPEIYMLHSGIGPFVNASTDSELRQFVGVMQSGTPAEQQSAVEAAIEKTIASLSQTPSAATSRPTASGR